MCRAGIADRAIVEKRGGYFERQSELVLDADPEPAVPADQKPGVGDDALLDSVFRLPEEGADDDDRAGAGDLAGEVAPFEALGRIPGRAGIIGLGCDGGREHLPAVADHPGSGAIVAGGDRGAITGDKIRGVGGHEGLGLVDEGGLSGCVDGSGGRRTLGAGGGKAEGEEGAGKAEQEGQQVHSEGVSETACERDF